MAAGSITINEKISDWYRRESATSAYDLWTRIPAVLYAGFVLSAQARAIMDVLLVDHGLAPSLRIASCLARSATFAAVLSFTILTIVRMKPVSRANGIWPRVAALLGTAFISSMVFLERPEPSLAWDLSSALLISLGGFLMSVVVAQLGRSFSIMPEARALVTTGPYSFVRHPLYVVEELAAVGMLLQYRSIAAAALALIHIALQFQRMRCEEKVLAEAFPDYAGYCEKTARLVPGIY